MNMMMVVVLSIINLGVTYAFFYYLLHSIKREVSIPWAALILLVLLSLAMMTCPIVLSVMKKCLGFDRMITAIENMMGMQPGF